MSENDSYRSAINKAAALSRVANEGGAAVSAPARRAFLEKFIDQVDPDRTLPEDERHKRAAAARKAYFTKLAAKSAQTRRQNASKAQTASEAQTLRKLADDIEFGNGAA
ncbi:MAG: hypothetical protein HQ526_09000 [Actinobacteria bacterium]|nr:hypothetical protein [Actinomycetota bacterium]